MYKIFSHGNTVSRKTYSTTIESLLRQQNLTYLFLIRKIYFPKTQDFLQPPTMFLKVVQLVADHIQVAKSVARYLMIKI